MLRGAALSRFLLQKYGRTWDDVPLPGVGLKDLDGRVFDGFRQRGADSERLPQDILDESDEGVIESRNDRSLGTRYPADRGNVQRGRQPYIRVEATI